MLHYLSPDLEFTLIRHGKYEQAALQKKELVLGPIACHSVPNPISGKCVQLKPWPIKFSKHATALELYKLATPASASAHSHT